AAAGFLAEYLDVLDAQGVLDYAELVHRAVLLAGRPEVAAELAGRYDAVFVDEYQDTDVAQGRLLRALAGGGRTLLAFGDPDQSIYAFRGADVGGILRFREDFPRADGRPADVEVLTVSRRSGAALLAATRRITGRMPLTRLPARAVRAHRELVAARDGGRVEVFTYPSAGAELDNVADILRRAHLEDGVPWREMAVLVRAGGRSIPGVRRALTSAGVPVEVDGDDIPLRHEPAVAPLLTALRAAATAALPDSGGLSAVLGVETALTLLTSPLGGMDAADLRRQEERSAGRAVPRPSDVLLAEALAEPERLAVHDPAYARGAQQLGQLLRTARESLVRGGTAEEALWVLWDGTSWPGRLERTARRGGTAARNADRDLDAVCALFETAARAEERTGGRGALNFLEEIDAQDIAADTLSRRTVRPDAVRLMTAHRSKGHEWS
ncbi:UvrD-helicase domain-containing protein, partial [Streptomyces milbemycinicus]